MAIVYGLRAKDSSDYFYIGCTKRPLSVRFQQHIRDIKARRHLNNHLIHKANKIGLDNIIADVLEETTDADKFEREQYWIDKHIKDGVKLTNIVLNNDDQKFAALGRKYSLRRNWDWAVAWYYDYKRGIVLIPNDDKYAEMAQLAQARLAEIIEQLLPLTDAEREIALERYE